MHRTVVHRLPGGCAVALAATACGAALALAALAAPHADAATVIQPTVATARQAPGPAAAQLQAVAAAPALPAQPGCGFFDVTCHVGQAIDSWFASLVTSAINPLFSLLGRTQLATPQVGGFAAVRGLWTGSLAIADTSYVLLVLIGGIVVMSHQTLQTSYAVKEIAPRLVVGFLAANLSLLLAGKAITFADGLSTALAGQGLDPAAAEAMLRSLIERVIGESGMFFILLALFAVVLLLVLTIIYIARLMLTVVLIAMAPLALACHALPHTEGFARWWWRAFAGILLIQSAQALVLVAAARVFLTEQCASVVLGGAGGPSTAAAFDAIQLLCLLYILIRIPFWIYRHVWSPSGRSPLRSAVRFVFAAAVLRRVAPTLSGRSSGAGAARSRPGGGPGPGAGARPGPRPLPPGRGPGAGSGTGTSGPRGTGPGSGPPPGPRTPRNPGHRPNPGSGSGGTPSR
jgi:hypothetical protein